MSGRLSLPVPYSNILSRPCQQKLYVIFIFSKHMLTKQVDVQVLSEVPPEDTKTPSGEGARRGLVEILILRRSFQKSAARGAAFWGEIKDRIILPLILKKKAHTEGHEQRVSFLEFTGILTFLSCPVNRFPAKKFHKVSVR